MVSEPHRKLGARVVVVASDRDHLLVPGEAHVLARIQEIRAERAFEVQKFPGQFFDADCFEDPPSAEA